MYEDDNAIEDKEEIDDSAVLDEADLDIENDSVIDDDEQQPFDNEREALSEEELDHVADTAIEVIRIILKYFGAENATIDEYEGDEGEILLDIVGEDLAVLIGRHGKTLEAMQFLVSSIVNKKLGFRYPVIIDIEGYKYRRKQKLEGIAKSAAMRAVKQNAPIRLRPMPPYERRIIHIALRGNNRVTTVSEGDDPNRYVVISPVR